MAQHDPVRRQEWAGQTPHQILDRYRPGKAPPLKVLGVLLELFNARHTSLDKTVSHKTRHERAQFLRRFFRDLNEKAGFKKLPDPRNLGQKHLRAMVQVWQREHLAPATIQTYLSFLRGLGMWTGKNGFVREPAYYGLNIEEYQRHEYAQRDKSWSANGVDIDALVAKVCEYDRYVGASLRLIRAMGLRRKESVLFRPFENAVAFADTGLPHEQRAADRYVWVRGKGGRIRHIPLDRPARADALAFAQQVVSSPDAHMGDPSNDLKKNLRRFDYVLEKFGITFKQLGVTAHGLRHEVLIDHYAALTGQAPPVRGGAPLPIHVDQAARQAVTRLAGHARTRASGAYLGQFAVMRSKPRKGPPGAEPDGSGST
ncbi:MAG: phage integrase N-terminal domain-containing protein [Burkholderiaceae bacterium]